MDRTLTAAGDRRAHPRRARTSTRWCAAVLVRPGREACLLDISEGGALIEIGTPLRPGTHIQLQLSAHEGRLGIRGRVMRCYVASITGDAGVRYHGAIAFDVRLSSLATPEPIGVRRAGAEYGVPDMGTRVTTAHEHALPVVEQPGNV